MQITLRYQRGWWALSPLLVKELACVGLSPGGLPSVLDHFQEHA